MSALSPLSLALSNGGALDPAEARLAARSLADEAVPPADKRDFLVALAQAGETVEVVTAFAEVFRELARDPGLGEVASQAIDIVGTGGTGSRGYNISSATAVIVAACGQPVLKHGNRAVTSSSGAADFLGALGVTVQAEAEVLRRCAEELNFCFFFAPAFHPAFKSIMPVRMELGKAGQRTIFNILGPLINPARPRYQLLGVLSPAWVGPLADALTRLGVERGVTVHCRLADGRGMDELTTAGRNEVRGIGHYDELDGIWGAEHLGLPAASPASVSGGSAEENVAAFRALLNGSGDPGLRETLVLNAGVALHVTGAAESVAAGIEDARAALRDGRVASWLDRARAFFASLDS